MAERPVVVYTLTNLKTNVYYVGHTIDFNKRRKTHFSTLRKGNHHNLYLQAAYIDEMLQGGNEEETFVMSVVQQFDTLQEALTCEQYYLDHYKEQLYNVSPHGWTGGDLLTSHPYKTEIVEKIKLAITEKLATLTTEERKSKWGLPGSSNHNYKGAVYKVCPLCKGVKSYYAEVCRQCKKLKGIG